MFLTGPQQPAEKDQTCPHQTHLLSAAVPVLSAPLLGPPEGKWSGNKGNDSQERMHFNKGRRKIKELCKLALS
eukprot:1144025-Pelagomonas_calceolata.AAC.1